jgi:hypothetical protein
MKIELKPIIDQLTEAIELPNGQKVSALIDDDGDSLVGWTVVNIYEDGTIEPISKERYGTIKELIEAYK